MASPSTQQWKRICEVIVGARTKGEGLLIKDLKITFEITKTIGSAPNTALVKIYNLSQDHELQIAGKIGDLNHEDVEANFDEVLINAGYAGNARLIFRGNIRHATRYREGNNYIMELDAGDGDKDIRHAIVNTTLAAGSTTSHLVDHIVSTFGTTTAGPTIIKDRQRIRGRTVSGRSADVLDTIALESDAHWSIQDGALQIVNVDSTLPTEAIVLRSDTGLLGAPELSDKGIKAKCLLNPQIAINGKVQIDNNDLKDRIRTQRDKAPGAKPHKAKKKKGLARLDPDGIYKVFKLVHHGDTRGDDWFTEVHCLALGQPIPAGRQAA